MSPLAVTTGVIGTAGAIGGGLGGAVIQGEYQKQLQDDQQQFITNLSKNQIKHNVNQMKELGYSPSMLFGGNSPTGGGAGGGSMGKAPDFAGPILQAINTVGNLWMRDKELDNKQKQLDVMENRALNENAASTAIALNNSAQEQYWNQKYYNLDPNHPLNNKN